MSLIVHQPSTSTMFAVDPDWDYTTDGAIYAGQLVCLTSTGFVRLADNATTFPPLGIAGDTLANGGQQSAYSAELVITPSGRKRFTQNRISDEYDETMASGKMTVYTTGGEFFTDQYDAAPTPSYAVGLPLYSDATGSFTTNSNSSAARRVGWVLAVPAAYPSGVPGVDSPAVDQSMSLGEFLKVQFDLA